VFLKPHLIGRQSAVLLPLTALFLMVMEEVKLEEELNEKR
jgi:hypothetical protein